MSASFQSSVPRVSLVTACFNARATIGRTLRSVSTQTGGFHLEHLIQDGGSTDGTVECIAEYTRDASHRVAPVSRPDAGYYDAVNQGVARATGDIIGLLNADDWLADAQVLRDVVRRFAASPTLEAVYADLDYVRLDPNDRSGDVDPTAIPRHRVVRHWVAGPYGAASFRNGWMPPHPTVYVRRDVYERCGGYRLDLGTAADYEWLVRVFAKHRVVAEYLPRVTVKMLSGGQSNGTMFARLLANRNDRRAWHLNHLRPAPWFALAKPARKLHQFFGW